MLGPSVRRRFSRSMFVSLFALVAAVVTLQHQSQQQQGHGIFARAQSSGSDSNSTSLADGCVTDYDEAEGVDYFSDKANVSYAETFTVEYFNSYKVLTITSATYGSATYVLYQCGTNKPDLDVDVQLYVSIPVTRVATGTPDHIPRIELLGQRDTIVAYTGDTTLIGSPCADALVANGTITEATTTDATCGTVADNDVLIDLDVNVTFSDNLLVAHYCENPTLGELHNGVAIYSFEETGETSGLGEGEHIKLFSLFYNEEAAATEIFDEIVALWDCTVNNAEGCSLLLNNVPSVAWFPYVPTDPASVDYQAGWFAPIDDVYYAYAIENAKGLMLTCAGQTDYSFMSDDEMLDCFESASVCIFAADYVEVQSEMNSTALEQLACVQNERVYDITLSGINAWFEAKTVEPHVLIEDIVVVLHGDDFNYGIGDYERLLLRNVFTEESESGTYFPDEGSCDDPDAALEIQGECDIIIDFNTCADVESDGASPATRNVVVSWATTTTFVAMCSVFTAAAAAVTV